MISFPYDINMKKTLCVLTASILCLSAQAQTFAKVRIGSTTTQVKKALGNPSGTETNSWHGLKAWRYDVIHGPMLYVAFDGSKVAHVVAFGTKDYDSLYVTKKGVSIGDTVDTVKRIYGKPEELKTQNLRQLRYKNVVFTFTAGKVIMIDVFGE